MRSYLLRFARRHALWQPATRVVAAVSGGADSVAMLWLLHDLHVRGEVCLDAVAHFHHGIRAEADLDQEFCAALAARLGLPFVTERVNVPELARARRQSLEVAGRAARRAFLEKARHQRQADRIATAHTEDDQAETVLLRLLRGAGPRGLSGIAPRRGAFVRPVLWATREELRAELGRRGEAWREDATNLDLDNPRNRLRHEVLPLLERHFNPSARRAFARVADLARADDALLWREAAAASLHLWQRVPGGLRIDREALARLPEAIARRVAIHGLAAVGGQTSPAFLHVQAVMDIAAGRAGPQQVPGMAVEPSGRYVVLVDERRLEPAPAPFRYELPVPGEIRLPEAGFILQASGPFPRDKVPVSRGRAMPERAERAEVVVSADELASLVVRSRRRGDRVAPLGLGGRKKVQDVLVDRKVPRRQRDRVPIVTDERDRIVWVAGHVVGAEFAVTAATNAVIILKLQRV